MLHPGHSSPSPACGSTKSFLLAMPGPGVRMPRDDRMRSLSAKRTSRPHGEIVMRRTSGQISSAPAEKVCTYGACVAASWTCFKRSCPLPKPRAQLSLMAEQLERHASGPQVCTNAT